MTHRRVVRTFALLYALVLGTATACQPAGGSSSGSTGPGASQGPKRVTAVVMGELNSLNAKVNTSMATIGQRGQDEAERLVNSGLTVLDPRGNRYAQLAEAFPTAENGLWQIFPDGKMVTTWKLRSAARWHDGVPFTTEDILFTYRLAKDRDLATFSIATLDYVQSVDAPDPLTLTVNWTRPSILADDFFSNSGSGGNPAASSLLPQHLLERAYLDGRDAFFDLPYWNAEYVGTGPFKVREFARSSHVRLIANDEYVLGRPKIDEIEIRFINDPETLIANFLSGTVDFTLNSRFSLDQVTTVLPKWPQGRVELEHSSAIIFYPQMMNPNPAVVGDLRFRRALITALDRQEMADALQGGLVPKADSIVHPDSATYPAIEKDIVRYDYDPRQGSQVIEGLGYQRGSEGLFRDASGQPLKVEMRVTAGRDVTTKSTLAIQDYWQRIGVTTDANIVPQQRSQDREYMATFPSFYMANQGVGDLGGGTFTRIRLASIGLPENGFRATGNWARYNNADYEALVDKFLVTIPIQERTQVMGQIIHQLTEQLIISSLFFNPLPVMVNNRLQGVTAASEGWNAQDWYVTG